MAKNVAPFYELVAATAQFAEPDLQEALRRFVDAGFFSAVCRRRLFKHALVQDTAYRTLLRSPRQVLHRRIAEAMEQWFSEVVETRPEIVAHR